MEKSKVKVQGLKKDINLFEAILLVVGIVIGSGVFFKPSAVFKATGAPGLGMIAWVLGGIISMCGALCIAELGSAIPKTGGLIIYLKELYGEKYGFLLGWVYILIYFPGINAALAVIFATQCTSFMDITPMGQKLLAVGLVIVTTAINLISTKVGAKFAGIATVGKLIPLGVIILAGLLMGKVHNFTPIASPASTSSGFGAAVLGVLFAYNGWVAVANMSEELKDPVRDLPRAIMIGLSIITIVYLGVNLAIINTIPMSAVITSPKPASDAAIVLFGHFGANLIAVGILVSILGCLSSFIMAGARIPYAMSKDKLFFYEDVFSKLNKNGTPSYAMILVSVITCIYAYTGSFDTLSNLAVFTIWLFFILRIGGVFILRAKHKELITKDTYKVPFYPVIPILGVLGAAYVVVSTLIANTSSALYGVAITLVGLPVYLYFKKRNKKRAML